MRLETIICLSLCVSGLLCWGAMRTAQAIAEATKPRIEITLNQ